jgi:hypothetical protein
MPLHNTPSGPERFRGQRLTEVPKAEFEAYLEEVRESMALMHPNISRFPNIAVLVANEIAYGIWRKQRVYDHLEILFGAATPDGGAGYTLHFHQDREAGHVTAVTLTRAELDELVEKGTLALKEEEG